MKTKGKKSKDNSDDEDDEDGTRYRTFNIPLDPNDEDGETYKQKVAVFDEGNPEEWVKWRIDALELFKVMGCSKKEDSNRQHHVNLSILNGKAKEEYIQAYNKRHSKNRARVPEHRMSDHAILRNVVNDVAKKFFPNWGLPHLIRLI